MIDPTRRWTLPGVAVLPAGLVRAGLDRGLSPRLLRLLARRGCRDGSDLGSFLDAAETCLHDPALLPDADVVRDRIARARADGERVLVLGDFDADGLTGLAILARTLDALGIDAVPYVPDRVAEGHGVSLAAVDAAERLGCRLIVSVDCGTSSRTEIGVAAARGIDTIVTDHHHLPPDVPPAIALVNPQRPDSTYPDDRLTGAGVALKVAQLLLDAGGLRHDGALHALDLTDLAAIGTVADVAPIVGENRSIVRLGLERMRRAPRPAIAALADGAGVGGRPIDVETVGFQVAPRINAASRMGDAGVAMRLLLTDDPEQAERLAAELEASNASRREVTSTAVAEAREALGDPGSVDESPAIVVAGPWPVGIIGLVAGKLAEEFTRPAVVVSTSASPWRGSARSLPGLHLAEAFGACSRHFLRYGGHAAAAGCELEPASFEAFRADFLALARSATPPDPRPELFVELVLRPGALDYGLFRELGSLEPFGAGNARPLLGIVDAEVVRVREATGGHAQLTIRGSGNEILDAIAFGRGDLAGAVQAGDRLDLVARLESRSFGGYESLQLEILDAATPGILRAAVEARRAEAAALSPDRDDATFLAAVALARAATA